MNMVLNNERKTFFFHIGLPKTGSTSIQYALLDLSAELKKKGIYVPFDRDLYGDENPKFNSKYGSPQVDGLHYFFDILDRRPFSTVNWESEVEEFLADETLRTFVLSHENIVANGERLRPGVFSRIAAESNIKFAINIRNPVSYLNSHYLQALWGKGRACPRERFAATADYLERGYSGFLRPFRQLGDVHLGNFDRMRIEGNLLPEFFSILGADDLSGAVGAIPKQNTNDRLQNLGIVFLAIKSQFDQLPADWLNMRSRLKRVAADLEQTAKTSFIQESLGRKILERWESDQEKLKEEYGYSHDIASDFKPGPEVLSFSTDYAESLKHAARGLLKEEQYNWLLQGLSLANEDIEDVLNRRPKSSNKRRKKGTKVVNQDRSAPKAGDAETRALALALFRASEKASASESESTDQKGTFKENRAEFMSLARQTMKFLKKQNYTLTSTGE